MGIQTEGRECEDGAEHTHCGCGAYGRGGESGNGGLVIDHEADLMAAELLSRPENGPEDSRHLLILDVG